MISDSEFSAWIRRDSGDKVILVEQQFQIQQDNFTPLTNIAYLATKAYITTVRAYTDCVQSVPSFSRSVDRGRLGGQASLSLGTVVINNPDGKLDYLLGLACDGSVISFYLGDMIWERESFRLMFSAITQKVDTPSDPSEIIITIKDVGLLTDVSVGGTQLIGGTGANADRPRPYLFGYVHQAECLVQNFATLTYVYGDTGSVVDTTGYVRDGGNIVLYTDAGDGTLTLSASPVQAITADLYREVADALPGARCSQLVDELVGTVAGLAARGLYRGAHASFNVGGLDDYPVGLYVTDKRNLQDILEQWAATALAFYTTTRDGKFTFGRLWPQDIASLHLPISATLKIDDVAAVNLFVIEHGLPTYYAVPAIVNMNWTSQTTFGDALSADQQAIFTRKGLYVDPVLAPETEGYDLQPNLYHKLLVKAAAQETIISAIDDATVLPYAVRWTISRIAQLLPWLEFIDVTTDLHVYALELGDVVCLDLEGRYGLDGNSMLQVCGINQQLSANRIGLTLVRRRPATVTI